MPPKINKLGETSSKKKSTKLKKRNLKSKRDIKNKDLPLDKISLEDSKTSNSISSVEYYRGNFNDGNNVRLTHSESFVGSRASVYSNMGIKNSDSYCDYKCSCLPLKGCQRKSEMNFNLRTHNGIPIKQTHQGGGNNYSMHRNNKKPNEFLYNNLDQLISPSNSQQPSYQSRNSYPSEASINRRASYDSPSSYTSQIKPKASAKSNCNACVQCEHSDSLRNTCAPKLSTQNHSCQCNCNLCRKASPTRTSSLRSVRQSFSSSKSCPQLDIIKEEEPENEDYANSNKNGLERSNSKEFHSKPETLSKSIQSGPLKIQKSLEDSCADFLNIVCDNILESVQKSVDTKLQEYSNNVEKNVENLGRKMDKSEAAVKAVCWEILKKMTEQNKNNFEQICALVQNLVENRTANQYTMTRNNCQDKQCQWEPLLRDGNKGIMEILDGEVDRTKTVNNEDGRMEINTNYVAESASHNKNESIRKEEKRNDIKSKWCNCCHCNDTISVQPLEIHKSYFSKTATQTIDPPSYYPAENFSAPKAHLVNRSVGGCTYCGKYKRENIQLVRVPINHHSLEVISPRSSVGEEDLQTIGLPIEDVTSHSNSAVNNKSDNPTTMELPLKFPAPQVTSPRTSEILTTQTKSDTSQRDLSLPKYTTFCLTPPGKTIFNCNCSATGYVNNGNIGVCACKPSDVTNLELKPVCRNLYDNYDTSGYATEPEDNNDITGCNSARKKLQKKASKQHCSSQTSEMGNIADRYDQSSGSHIGKRSSKTNSTKTSPTRLSRL